MGIYDSESSEEEEPVEKVDPTTDLDKSIPLI
jgi:hypothetical protein